jgi:hypothetical protein
MPLGSGAPRSRRPSSATSVPDVLHPVGPLPAAVYWRRRLVLLLVLLALLAGGGWLGWTLWTNPDGASSAAGTTTERSRTEVPALERVVPSLASVRTPTPPSSTVAAEASSPAPTAAPEPGSACTDEMLGLAVRAPASASVGSKPTFELVVTNTAAVPCVRALDKGLQELVLLDGAGNRVWGSNDCFPELSDDTRTLAPGEVVSFPVVWGGLTSEPTCTAQRTAPAPGSYVLRGRLDTKTSPDTAITLG